MKAHSKSLSTNTTKMKLSISLPTSKPKNSINSILNSDNQMVQTNSKWENSNTSIFKQLSML